MVDVAGTSARSFGASTQSITIVNTTVAGKRALVAATSLQTITFSSDVALSGRSRGNAVSFKGTPTGAISSVAVIGRNAKSFSAVVASEPESSIDFFGSRITSSGIGNKGTHSTWRYYSSSSQNYFLRLHWRY